MSNRGPRPSGGRLQGGFTLIEVMIVVVIVGLLVAVALPSYRNSVIKTNRATAQGDLMGFAQAMEKEYALFFTYASAVAGTTFPAQSPIDGKTKKYNLSIVAATLGGYRLRATPIASSGQGGDGLMEINHLGQRFWDKNNDGDVTDAGENNWTK